jgi:hypothetical protein
LIDCDQLLTRVIHTSKGFVDWRRCWPQKVIDKADPITAQAVEFSGAAVRAVRKGCSGRSADVTWMDVHDVRRGRTRLEANKVNVDPVKT